jgi:hypothetical protein
LPLFVQSHVVIVMVVFGQSGRLAVSYVTVSVRIATHLAQQPTNTKTPDKPPTLTYYDLITMALIDDALAATELLKPGDHFKYREIGCCFNVPHTTLF